MNKMLPRALGAAALLGALGAALPVQAQDTQGPWLVRARVVNVDTANKSSAGGPLGLDANAITVSNKTIPEIDITYFITPNIAAELILTYPQKHNVYLYGDKIGTFKELPPTLMAQYHFIPNGTVRPYAGVGLNYTNISSVNILDGGVNLSRNSFGLAVGGGVDIALTKNVFLNFDLKKVQIRADVKTPDGTKISKVKVDPWLFGVGVGYRF
jgi:outer membrane protein